MFVLLLKVWEFLKEDGNGVDVTGESKICDDGRRKSKREVGIRID